MAQERAAARSERNEYKNPHAEPASLATLKRSLSFLLAYLANQGHVMSDAYALLLGSERDQHRARALLARRLAGAEGEAGGGGKPAELDLESALRLALLDCEKEAGPEVTAMSLQSVEDEEFPGYVQRRRRRMRLFWTTVGAFATAVALDASLVLFDES